MGLFSKPDDFIISESGISKVEKVFVGGIEQYILIQGESSKKPVLLFLHGGPSMPLPGVSCRGLDYTIITNVKKLVQHYTVVFWDQRGTGKSYNQSISQESMTIAQFIADANELTEYLRKTFKQEKIFLVAHSWGTILGLKLITLYPEKFYSYVGISQIINWSENDKICLKWAKEEANRRKNKRALKELILVGEPPFVESFKQWGVLRKWQARFNSMIYSDRKIKHPGLLSVAKPMFQSKDYTLKDVYNSFHKGFKLIYTIDFINELPDVDFYRTSKEVDIPVTFIHGTKDVHVDGKLVEQYFQMIHAKKGKQLIWMDKSAHIFHPEDTMLIEQYLIEEQSHVLNQ
ncbi:alpha/beta fold hydrolase [Halalkalibacter kiskunsagensis]|uniref:Alpha/beta fold hydrolase n=1 Tax=Halalkalibacter kiskunsagensis TaxID=1548599 RepID=A0ABV6KH68_9BACI